MGAGYHGGFGGTRGARTVYRGTSKGDALKAIPSLPQSIQKGVKSFLKGSSNNYNHYSVQRTDSGGYIARMENPGRVPGSKAIYYKVIDSTGKTLRVYKETYDPNGRLVHTKEK